MRSITGEMITSSVDCCRSDIDRREFCTNVVAAAVVPQVMDGFSLEREAVDSSKKVSTHKFIFTAAQNMGMLNDATIDLVMTSPPYPMIEMWDSIFAAQNKEIQNVIGENPIQAFELMHKELDKVWTECFRVLKDGGFLCVNIGDATRTINGSFRLYNNHSRIVDFCTKLGFSNLPGVIWRKQTNAPNKFMGSGMLPCGAYVTLEHEWILVFRKGDKRLYKKSDERNSRRESAFFWEERNVWFSDLWEIKGTRQSIEDSSARDRNASFPLEIPFRIINMYSQRGDTVLDPFVGLGTTTIAAMLSGRNSVGIDIDVKLKSTIRKNIAHAKPDFLNTLIQARYEKHLEFIKERELAGKGVKYKNVNLGCNVMTSQESDMRLYYVAAVDEGEGLDLTYTCAYKPMH